MYYKISATRLQGPPIFKGNLGSRGLIHFCCKLDFVYMAIRKDSSEEKKYA